MFYHIFKIKRFSDPESPYVVIVPGGIIDRNNLDDFIDISNLEQRKQYKIYCNIIVCLLILRFSKMICFRYFDFVNKKYRPLNICRLEFASLVGLLFWNSGNYNFIVIIIIVR